MFGLETIRAMNAEAAVEARRLRKKPRRVSARTIEALFAEKRSIPFLGDACDDVDAKYTRIDTLFCDSSGFGRSDEPALTHEQLKARLKLLLEAHGPLLLAISEQGQFQVYLAVWKAGAK
jgi:hypothetical protein